MRDKQKSSISASLPLEVSVFWFDPTTTAPRSHRAAPFLPMASNHKLVCARAARQQFGGAFQQAVRDYRWAKLGAATLKGLDAYLPDGLSFLPLSFLYDDEVARFAWEGALAALADSGWLVLLFFIFLMGFGARCCDEREPGRTREVEPFSLHGPHTALAALGDWGQALRVFELWGRKSFHHCARWSRSPRWAHHLYQPFQVLFGWGLSSRCQQSSSLPGLQMGQTTRDAVFLATQFGE